MSSMKEEKEGGDVKVQLGKGLCALKDARQNKM